MDQNKDQLEEILKDTIHGAHRVPALLVNHPYSSIDDHNLSRYECLPVEPLHAIKGHIINLYEEIPYHLSKQDKKTFNDAKQASFNGKEVKNGSDYRESLVNICLNLDPTFPFYDVFSTLCEIQEIMYQNESKRSITSVLRLYNITYLHMISLITKIKVPKHLTCRKLFGQYYHSIIIHAPQQYRIINGISSNAEKEERLFNVLKTVTKLTSNHHSDHVLYNSLIRLQVREAANPSKVTHNQNRISKSSKHLQTKQDTIFPHDHIRLHRSYFQSHLERIADYLLEEKVFWKETPEGITFFDVTPVQSSMHLHHFRSSTIASEVKYVKRCWVRCLEDSSLIPAYRITVEDELENISIIKPSTLNSPPSESSIEIETSPVLPSTPVKEPLESTPLFPKYVPKKRKTSTPTSTPRSRRSATKPTSSNETENQESDDIPVLTKVTPKLPKSKPTDEIFNNKTTSNLYTVFGSLPILRDYDKYRTLFKKNPRQYEKNFKTVSAKLEVMVKNKSDDLNKVKREYEKSTLKANGYTFKKIEDPFYLDLISKLKILKALVDIF